MSMTDLEVRRAKPRAKPYKMYDSDGLFLLITPTGGKWWRYKYHYNKKEKLLSLGTYPDVPLRAAREKRDEERKKLKALVDPAVTRIAMKASWANTQSNTFEVVAREWIEQQSSIWAPSNTKKITGQLEHNAFPWLGNRPISEISAPELLAVMRRMEKRGAFSTAHKVLQTCGQIFRYAIVTARATRDIASDLRGALRPVKGKHLAAIIEPKEIGPLLRSLDGYQGGEVIRGALKLAPLVFVRPGELRQAEWKEIDFEKSEWNIPAERMKMK
ncbi:MAG: integrase arm-type DNA-binding domain-containing protein, partial [Alphaproteobacteria bacterium]